MFKRIADWWFGPRATRHDTVDHSREKVYRGGDHIWTVTDDGAIYLFGWRPGGQRQLHENRFGLQRHIWEAQSRSGDTVVAMVVTAAVAHDLIAYGELTHRMLKSAIVQDDGQWYIVVPRFFDSDADLVIINGHGHDWMLHTLPRPDEAFTAATAYAV